MVFRRSNRALPIAVDIGSSAIRLIQLQQDGGRLVVRAASCFDIPVHLRRSEDRTDTVISAIQDQLKEHDFVGRNVVSVVPSHAIHYKSFRVPHIPADELEQAVLFEAEERFAFDQTNAEYRYLDAGEVRHGQDLRKEILAMACRDDALRTHLEMFDRLGLVCTATLVAPCAVVRCFETPGAVAEDHSNIYADFGQRDTRITITAAGKVIFIKSLAIGGMKLDEMTAMKLNLSIDEAVQLRREVMTQQHGPGAARNDDLHSPIVDSAVEAVKPIYEQLSKEISLCLRYFAVTFRGVRPGHMTCVGGGAYDTRLCHFISEITGVPTVPGYPLGGVDPGEAFASKPGEDGHMAWATAMGLALHGATQVPQRKEAS